jgi:hypothetical protein
MDNFDGIFTISASESLLVDEPSSSEHISDLLVTVPKTLLRTRIESNHNHSAVIPYWGDSYTTTMSDMEEIEVRIKTIMGNNTIYTAVVGGKTISVRRFPIPDHNGRIFGIEIGFGGVYAKQLIPTYTGVFRGYTVKTDPVIKPSIPSTKNIVFPNNFQLVKTGKQTFAVDFLYPESDIVLSHDAAFIITTPMFHNNS